MIIWLSLFITCYVWQYSYILYFHVTTLFNYSASKSTPVSKEGVSILIAAHNELKNLQCLIPKLLQQQYATYEIIIALDRSKDGSEEWLKNLQASFISYINIKTVPQGINPKKNALISAIDKAQYENLLFIDADCIPSSKHWITHMTKNLSSTSPMVIGVSPLQTSSTLLGLLQHFETINTMINYIGFGIRKKAYMGVGRNIAYRKELFQQLNGFSPYENVTGGDDDLFVQKVTAHISPIIELQTDSITTSKAPTNWKSWLLQKKRHVSVSKYYQIKHKILLGSYSLTLTLLVVLSIVLLGCEIPVFWIILPFSLRTLLLFTTFTKISTRIGLPKNWIVFIPILELLYIIYMLAMGMLTTMSKKVRWK